MSRVVAAGCLRDRGASHPGSLGIRCQNSIVRLTNLTANFTRELHSGNYNSSGLCSSMGTGG